MGIHGDTEGYKGLHGVTSGYRGVTRGYRGLQGITRVTETFFLARTSLDTLLGLFCIKIKVEEISNF